MTAKLEYKKLLLVAKYPCREQSD